MKKNYVTPEAFIFFMEVSTSDVINASNEEKGFLFPDDWNF